MRSIHTNVDTNTSRIKPLFQTFLIGSCDTRPGDKGWILSISASNQPTFNCNNDDIRNQSLFFISPLTFILKGLQSIPDVYPRRPHGERPLDITGVHALTTDGFLIPPPSPVKITKLQISWAMFALGPGSETVGMINLVFCSVDPSGHPVLEEQVWGGHATCHTRNNFDIFQLTFKQTKSNYF